MGVAVPSLAMESETSKNIEVDLNDREWLREEIEKYENPEQMFEDVMIAAYVVGLLNINPITGQKPMQENPGLAELDVILEILELLDFNYPMTTIACQGENTIYNKWVLKVSPLVRIVLDSEPIEYSETMSDEEKNNAIKELDKVRKVATIGLQVDFMEVPSGFVPGIWMSIDVE